MIDGVRLTLMVGPAVPVPAQRFVIDALTEVEVQAKTEGASAFQLSFALPRNSPLETLFLVGGGASAVPIMRVVIIVTMRGVPRVLMDGVMTNHELTPGSDGGAPTLTVTGEDLRRVMDYIELTGMPYPAMPAMARVNLMLVKYLAFGIVPMVIPSVVPDVPIPIDRIPTQKGTDLQYIEALAELVGHVFYVDPGPAPLTSTAYWGPPIKFGLPQPALNVDMDAHTNVESLSFGYDSEKATVPIVFIQNQETKVPIPIPIPPVTPLSPPLGAVPPIPKNFRYMFGTSKMSPAQAVMVGLAESARSNDVVTAQGALDVLRYGRLLKPRGLVGVRGAGLTFDGIYYVDSVTTRLRRGEIKQSFSLTRNALISNTPKVPV